jgi:DNA polymerase-4
MCGSPRTVGHPELFELTVAHVDCDAFYASIEKRDDPSLADRPVIVGGGKRGVVAAACYVARTYGIHSAMPMFKALKACPNAVIVPPNMEKYASVAREVRALMLALTPAVEPLSIDEAFLDLAGTERLHGAPPAAMLSRFQRKVEAEIGITTSVGLSYNKFLAKIASDLDKPRGFAVIGRAETISFLAERPASLIWGVGKAMQARLAADGLTLIGDLQRIDGPTLAARYGAVGARLARLAHGEDDRQVRRERAAKTVSAETTLDRDTGAADDLLPLLCSMAERVSRRLKQHGLAAQTIVLKLKTAEFRLRTRNARLDEATNLAALIYRAGKGLLLKELDGTKFRLIGIGAADITTVQPLQSNDLIASSQTVKLARAELAIDQVRERFGIDQLGLGITFGLRRGPSRSA